MCPPCCPTHPTISNRYVNLQGSQLGYTKIPLDPPASCGFSLEKVVIHGMHIFRVNTILFFVYINVVKEDLQRVGKTEEDARGWCQIEADNSLWRPLKAETRETTVAQVLLFFSSRCRINYVMLINFSFSLWKCFPVAAEATYREWYRHDCVPGTRGAPLHS